MRTTVVLSGEFDEPAPRTARSSVTERYSSRKTGKRVDVCKTGTRNWSARP